MHIAHLTPELAPIAKVGGLADVVYGLSRETLKLGHDLLVLLPKYDFLNACDLVFTFEKELSVSFNDKNIPYKVWKSVYDSIPIRFIDFSGEENLFKNGAVYGYPNDPERFAFFTKASLHYLDTQTKPPDIIHLHDWTTALATLLGRKDPRSKFVFTIHNMEHQGWCGKDLLDKVGLDSSRYLTSEYLQDPLYPDAVNLLKGGILFSDFVTTVSPQYAKEVLTPDFGRNLDKILLQKKTHFEGILNGIDASYWNGETDPFLPFPLLTMPTNSFFSSKARLKNHLQEKLGLAQISKPLVASIGRLVPQKGVHLLKEALSYTLMKGGQFVLLGTCPIPSILTEFETLKAEYASNPNVSINLVNSEELAHLIYAGADLFVVPSLFEPCGITQLIALRYGAIPVVRKTGGLADTIVDIDSEGETGNGFSFDEPTEESLRGALDRAFTYWSPHEKGFQSRIMQGMKADFSWKKSALRYIQLYTKLKATPRP